MPPLQERQPAPPPIANEEHIPNEEHINHIFEMGLAKRAKAIQVLKVVGGNLMNAITLLLATPNDEPFNPTWIDRPTNIRE